MTKRRREKENAGLALKENKGLGECRRLIQAKVKDQMTKILETLGPLFRRGIYLLYRMLVGNPTMRDGNEFPPSVPLCRVVRVVPAVVFGRPLTHAIASPKLVRLP